MVLQLAWIPRFRVLSKSIFSAEIEGFQANLQKSALVSCGFTPQNLEQIVGFPADSRPVSTLLRPTAFTLRCFLGNLPVPLTDRDRQLINDLLSGSPGSWRSFVDRFSGLIQQVIRQTASAHSFRLSADDADDLCADTFAELLLRDMAVLRNFRGRSSFATYLAVIARRIVVRRMTEQRFLGALGHVNAHKVSVEQASTDAPAGRQLEQREQVEQLLKKLPDESRQLLSWIYLDGINWQEAARRLGRPLNSIGPMLSRIRQAFHPLQQR